MPKVSVIHDFLHLIFPHVCLGCGSDIVGHEHQLCVRCNTQLPKTSFFQQPGNPIEKTFYGRIPVQKAGAAYFFTKDSLLENLVYSLKYRSNQDIGNYLGQQMGRMIQEGGLFEDVDLVVPLPLNAKREKKRGYNQSAVLCRGITSVWPKPMDTESVYRKTYTETQTKKSRISRWQNMDGVFAVRNEDQLKNKHILLVDDVVTTGATLEACGSEILKIEGTRISIATLACTV